MKKIQTKFFCYVLDNREPAGWNQQNDFRNSGKDCSSHILVYLYANLFLLPLLPKSIKVYEYLHENIILVVPEKNYKLFNINLSRIHIVHVYSCERPKFTNKIKFCLVRGTRGVVRLFPPLCCSLL